MTRQPNNAQVIAGGCAVVVAMWALWLAVVGGLIYLAAIIVHGVFF